MRRREDRKQLVRTFVIAASILAAGCGGKIATGEDDQATPFSPSSSSSSSSSSSGGGSSGVDPGGPDITDAGPVSRRTCYTDNEPVGNAQFNDQTADSGRPYDSGTPGMDPQAGPGQRLVYLQLNFGEEAVNILGVTGTALVVGSDMIGLSARYVFAVDENATSAMMTFLTDCSSGETPFEVVMVFLDDGTIAVKVSG